MSGAEGGIFRADLLDGKVALVTGGGTGIGFGIAASLAAAGAPWRSPAASPSTSSPRRPTSAVAGRG